MKIFLILLAALLLITFIACNEETNRRSSKHQNIQTREITVVPLEKSKSKQYEQLSGKPESKFTLPVIVRDEEVSEPAPTQEDLKTGLIDNEDFNTEDYDNIVENKFLSAMQNPLSTFSIDVDEASYSNVRRYLQNGVIPPAGAVRIEEMINYFNYDYPKPTSEDPFTVNTEISDCPWNNDHRLVHIGLQGKVIPTENLPPSNMVFLVDVSGSMDEPNKLPLVQASMNLLTDQLREQDKVAIVVYAGSAGLVLPPTRGSNKVAIKLAINRLEAGGSTPEARE
jgi:Ca-activated chloride channel family protein